jgi:hypothetical protein
MVLAYQPTRTRRSSVEWAVRSFLALAVALIGFVVVRQSVAEVIAKSDPARAFNLAPSNGRIAARLAQLKLRDQPTGDERSNPALLARSALRHDPTAVVAVATLGFQAQLRGKIDEARRFFAYAEQLSRRDLSVHIWAVEDAVGRGDIGGALTHYDVALRTSKSAPEILFPVLSAAILDEPVRLGLVKTLSRQPIWTQRFVSYVAEAQVDPHARAALFAGLRSTGVPIPEEANAATINGLIAVADMAAAWDYYAKVRVGVNRRASRDPRFTANLSTSSPFDWNVSPDTSLTASFQRGSQGGVFDFVIPSGTGGLLLKQMQMLPAGSYNLKGHSTGIDAPGNALPYWKLTCSDGRELTRVLVPNSSVASGGFEGDVIVPSDCPVQNLAMFASSSTGFSSVSGQIDDVRLFPSHAGGNRNGIVRR